MLAKRIISLLAILCCLLPAIGAMAAQVDCDSEYCFSGEEFGESLTGVCIIGLPDENTGTVMLGTRVVRSGDILTQQQLSQLTFRPLRTETDAEATVTYLPIYEDRVEKETKLTISVRGKADQMPVAEDSVLETYKNLPNQGRLKAHDPEGTALTYTVTRAPKRGEVTVNPDGSFTYTPKKNKVGTDSFTYTATDAAGNVSRQATVTVQILKPADKTFYTDTLGQDCRFAAEWLKNTGLFMGETLAGQSCFQPDKTVSRGEFVAMLVRTLGLRVEDHAGSTGFSEDVPTWLKPYLAAAQRAGLTAGWSDGSAFGAQMPITGPEAALLIQNALDMPASVMAGDMPLTDWALAVLAENALELPCEGALNRGDVASALYRVNQLIPDAPGMTVFRQ